MSRYRRALVRGATYFFTVNLRNRRSDLLVRHIDLVRETVCATKARHSVHGTLPTKLITANAQSPASLHTNNNRPIHRGND